jgi:hypothetical protein
MKWSVIRPKILEVFAPICGAADVSWRDRERAFVRPSYGAAVYLHTTGARRHGWDDIRLAHNVGTEKLDYTQAGIRAFTLSVLAEAYNHSDGTTALEYLEEIRDALQRPQILADLRLVGLTVTDVSQTTDLTGSVDDHVLSAASLDVSFAFANNRKASDGAAGLDSIDWIETVEPEWDP